MSSTDPADPEAWPPEVKVPSLTCSAQDGTPYARFPDVEEEIRHVLTTAPSTWVVKKLKSETIVRLIRTLRRCDVMADVLGKLFDQLGRRTAVIAGDYSKKLCKFVREEIADQVSLKVVELVLAEIPSRKSEYPEIAFRKTVSGLVINLVEARKDQPRIQQFAPLAGDADGYEGAGADQSAALPDDAPTPHDLVVRSELRDVILTVLNGLDDARHREALILYFFHGWPITDNDPTKPTLCKMFNVSDRQIQNWKTAVLAKLREAIGEKP